MCGGGGNNLKNWLFRFYFALVCAFGVVSLGVATELESRLQELEKQRQALQAKIQQEKQEQEALKKAQKAEIKAQKQAQAKQAKVQKALQKQEAKIQKDLQAQKLKAQKQTKKEQQTTELTNTQLPNSQISTQDFRDENARYYQKQNTNYQRPLRKYNTIQNPQDKNQWYVALVRDIGVSAMMLNANVPLELWNYGFANYGVAFESGYSFGKGADKWRVYFGIGYKYNYVQEDKGYVDRFHTVTHNVGLDWTPRLGSYPIRGVLGFYKTFSYSFMNGTSSEYRWGYFPNTDGYYSYYSWYEYRNVNLHILWFGAGTRLGFIFDIKEHFSIEIGSRITLDFSLFGFSDNEVYIGASIQGYLQQYLSLAYRF